MTNGSTEFYPIPPPEEWATGGEPMTARQRVALANVAAHDRIEVPFLEAEDDNGQRVTKAEAYILIAMILDGVRPTREYMDALGRDPDPYTTPPHPRKWANRNKDPTEMQLAWLNRLIDDMGIPNAAKAAALKDLTRGQASLLIGRLRTEKGTMRRAAEEQRMVFQNAVDGVRDELPGPAPSTV